MTDDRIYELAKQHLGGRGHDLIWRDDPSYAAACDMPKDARWSSSDIRAEQMLAFSRALLAEQGECIAREWDGCMVPMFDSTGNATDPLDIGATIRSDHSSV